jgi:hypothetical protein
MAVLTCPFCRHKADRTDRCSSCGTEFETYERRKQEQLAAICNLLNDGRFSEAKEIAKTLPAEFPDNRNDFLLLLSNISRDISIVEKCELAVAAMAEEDYARAAQLLRNIQAFDKNLNERVISLRRKAEQYTQNSEKLRQAEDQFKKKNFAAAHQLFSEIKGTGLRKEAAEYCRQLEEIKKDRLAEAVSWMRKNRFDIAARILDQLCETFPDMRAEIKGYLDLAARRKDMLEIILQAAKKAHREGRLLEAKIAYTLLGLQFPECLRLVRQGLEDLGPQIKISPAELHEDREIDLSALGLLQTGREKDDVFSSGMLALLSIPDIAPADLLGDGISDIFPVKIHQPGAADSIGELLHFEIAQAADFIFS